ncbi:MAG: hypothetical protein JKY30_05160 [Flavobacteriales bacterium]|nr:hypothetical protein [Flavobacteriales bacterium]
MKKMILGCFLASLFFACNSETSNKNEEASCEKKVVTDNTPNDDSELALLMRKLYLDADSIKQLIVNKEGTISDEFITELETVHSAIPTDPDVKTPEFKAFNELLINQAKVLQEDSANRVEGFNQFVNRCIDCHQSFALDQ